MHQEGIRREEEEEGFHKEAAGLAALEFLIKEEVGSVEEDITTVDGSKGEAGEDHFEEGEVVMVDGQEEDGTKIRWANDLVSLRK